MEENKFTKEEKVTLRRILSHSAGLTAHGFAGYQSDTEVPDLLHVLDGKNLQTRGVFMPISFQVLNTDTQEEVIR